jgi:hypothetical protein
VAPGSGLVIYEPAPAAVTLEFAWMDVPTTTLELAVANQVGQRVSGPVRVRLETAEGALPRVGALTMALDGRKYIYPASGVVQTDLTAASGGALPAVRLPRAMYLATITPLDGAGAITTVPIDLSGASERVAQTVRMASKILLTGKLLPVANTAGATLLAIDDDADPAVQTPAAVVDAAGFYKIRLDPGRTYSLILEPAPARALPRIFVRSLVAPDKDTVREDQTVPAPGLPLTGLITDFSGRPFPGALVEAYCIGSPPSCIDANAPNTDLVRPTAEAISDQNGAYRLVVPDPAIAN